MEVARNLSLLVFLFFAFAIDVIRAGEYCYSYSSRYRYYVYCAYGCCGSYYNRSCCSLSVGLIVGGVIGGIIFISVVIAVICCCIKKTSHSGRVVHPATGTQPPGGSIAIVHTGANAPQPYYGAQPTAPLAQPVPPPPYKQAGAPPPPAYTYSNPAYPPTGTPYPPPPNQAYPPPPNQAYPPPPNQAYPPPPNQAYPPPPNQAIPPPQGAGPSS